MLGEGLRSPAAGFSSLALPGAMSMASPGPSCQCLLPPALPWAELALDPTSPGPLPRSFRGVRPSSQGASSPHLGTRGFLPAAPGRPAQSMGVQDALPQGGGSG